jgi:hypothetical protein
VMKCFFFFFFISPRAKGMRMGAREQVSVLRPS